MNYLLLAFAVVDLALLAWTFRVGGLFAPRLLLLRLMLVGVSYDNLVQFVGHWYLEAAWYQLANVGRFLLHSAVLPFLTLFGLAMMREAGVVAAHNRALTAFCWLFTLGALAWGLYYEVFLLELVPESVLGVSKLVSASSLPPIATILTNALLLPMAALVWRKGGWSWMFLGALFIFLVNGATASQPWGFFAGNFAEVIFLLTLLATWHHFSPQEHTPRGQV